MAYALQIDRKTVTLLINGKRMFGGEHSFTSLDSVKSGLWVATKGVSFAGGNMVYDNFTLESGYGKIEEPDTVLDESEPEAPLPSQEDTDSILPPPPSLASLPPIEHAQADVVSQKRRRSVALFGKPISPTSRR